VEAQGRAPRGEFLGGENARRGSAACSRETVEREGTDSAGAYVLEVAIRVVKRRLRPTWIDEEQTAWRGGAAERRRRLPRRENLWRRNPKGATGMKQGRRGCERNEASRV